MLPASPAGRAETVGDDTKAKARVDPVEAFGALSFSGTVLFLQLLLLTQEPETHLAQAD